MQKFWLRATALFLLVLLTFAMDGNISYQPPTGYTDGSALLEQDLDFYSWYCNDPVTPLVSFPSIIGTRVAIVPLPTSEGTHTCWLTVTAFNEQESGASNTINFTIGPRTPNPPTNLTIVIQ